MNRETEQNRVPQELQKQKFYSSRSKILKGYYDTLETLGANFNEETIKFLINNLESLEATKQQEQMASMLVITFKEQTHMNDMIIDWFKEFLRNNSDANKTERDYIINSEIEFNNFKNKFKKLIHSLDRSYKKYMADMKSADDSINEIEKENTTNKKDDYVKDDIFKNEYEQDTIGDTFGRTNFDTLINQSENTALQNWYKFLQDLHESPIKSFVLNKNTICNFKLIFKNPYTGLTTDKEAVVHLSHSTSSKKTPVFSIGATSFVATSTGVKLLAGSLVTAALDNVPLPYLHAISYMNHSSVEDLPLLDLYIIPIENISEEGRYEVLLIKGIHFVDMKQNDNASSTGIYYAFNYFAEDIVPLDFSESEKYFKIQYEGNNNL